jgi:hypothetical protein
MRVDHVASFTCKHESQRRASENAVDKLASIFQTRRRQTDLKSGEGRFSRWFPPLFQTCRSKE